MLCLLCDFGDYNSFFFFFSFGFCRYSSEVKLLFKRLGVEPLVIELDEMGMRLSVLIR